MTIVSSVATRAARCTLIPIVSALLPPVPMPSTMRPGAISSSVAIALAVTDQWRVCGTVTPGPSLIFEVASAQAASVVHSSRHTRCESVIHTVSNPSASASCAWRATSATGWLLRMPTSNFTIEPCLSSWRDGVFCASQGRHPRSTPRQSRGAPRDVGGVGGHFEAPHVQT